MRTYIESNFVLELAYEQEEARDCRRIMEICAAGASQLAVPAFSLAEPHFAFRKRAGNRKGVTEAYSREMRELRRRPLSSDVADALTTVAAYLATTVGEEEAAVKSAIAAVAACADVIPLDRAVLDAAARLHSTTVLKPPDAIVLASVLIDLDRHPGITSLFLNRNTKDFGDDPEVVELLRSRGCRLLGSFRSGARLLESGQA